MRKLLLVLCCLVADNLVQAEEPKLVRLSLRAVEFDSVKLKKAGLTHPFQPRDGGVTQAGGTATVPKSFAAGAGTAKPTPTSVRSLPTDFRHSSPIRPASSTSSSGFIPRGVDSFV